VQAAEARLREAGHLLVVDVISLLPSFAGEDT